MIPIHITVWFMPLATPRSLSSTELATSIWYAGDPKPAETPESTSPTMTSASPQPAGSAPMANAAIEPIIATVPKYIGIRAPILVTSVPPSGEAKANAPGRGTISIAAMPTEYP